MALMPPKAKCQPPYRGHRQNNSPELIGETAAKDVFGGSVALGQRPEDRRVVAEGAEIGIAILEAPDPPVGQCIFQAGAQGPTGARRGIIGECAGRSENIMFLDGSEGRPAGRVEKQAWLKGEAETTANRRLIVNVRVVEIGRRAGVGKRGGSPQIRPFKIALGTDHPRAT